MALVDRRTSPRVSYSGIALVSHDPGSEAKTIRCRAGDLSESGMLLYPQRRTSRLAPDIRIRFVLPSGASVWIDVEATIVRRIESRRRIVWGVRFVCVPPRLRLRLRQFIETIRRQPRPAGPPPLPVARVLRPKPRRPLKPPLTAASYRPLPAAMVPMVPLLADDD